MSTFRIWRLAHLLLHRKDNFHACIEYHDPEDFRAALIALRDRHDISE